MPEDLLLGTQLESRDGVGASEGLVLHLVHD